jgi:hypothetical protein
VHSQCFYQGHGQHCAHGLKGIAALTSTHVLHVKHLDVPSWARFLQILEDAGPAWVVAVLYGQDEKNSTIKSSPRSIELGL